MMALLAPIEQCTSGRMAGADMVSARGEVGVEATRALAGGPPQGGQSKCTKNKTAAIDLRICSRESVVFGDEAGGCGCTLIDAQEGLR